MNCLFYYIAGYPMQWNRMIQFASMSVLVALFFQDYGTLLGTLFDLKVCIIQIHLMVRRLLYAIVLNNACTEASLLKKSHWTKFP